MKNTILILSVLGLAPFVAQGRTAVVAKPAPVVKKAFGPSPVEAKFGISSDLPITAEVKNTFKEMNALGSSATQTISNIVANVKKSGHILNQAEKKSILYAAADARNWGLGGFARVEQTVADITKDGKISAKEKETLNKITENCKK